MRMAVGLVFLYDAAVRWPYAVELYSKAGLPIPVFPAAAFPGTYFEPAALAAVWTVALHSLLLFALLAVTLGWRTRLSLCVVLLLSIWLGLSDHAGTFKKYSVIGLHLLLLLSCTRCGSAWSIDALLHRGRRRSTLLSPAWPRRLMQVLVVSVYLGGAVTKIRQPDFANGDLLMFSLLDDHWGGGYAGRWLSTQPNLLILASMGTVLFEIAFPLLIWNCRLRRPMLCLAVLFHLLLAATMSLGIFSAVMLAALLAFVEERDIRRFSFSHRPGSAGHVPERLGRRAAWASPSLWLLAAALWTAAGVAIQHKTDAYGVFAAGAPDNRPVPIDASTVTDILASLTPAQERRYDDYFHRVAIGNRLSSDGTHALGADTTFRRGMTVYACARLIGNHPSMQIEWSLIRPDGEQVQYAYRLDSATSHATVGFALSDPEQTPPGRYRLMLRADGFEVAVRSFDLRED
jgi:hypothetical protein